MAFAWTADHIYSEETRLITWLCICGLSFCCGVALVVGYYRFRRLRGSLIVEKRYPQLVLLESRFGMVLCFLLLPLLQCTYSELSALRQWQRYIEVATFAVYPAAHCIVE